MPHKAADLIRRDALLFLAPGATALEAAHAMTKARVGSILILSEDKTLQGIFTERDLMTRVVVAGKDPAKTLIEDVMTSELFTVSGEDAAHAIHHEMRARHIRHVPVLDGKTVIGVLGLRDILGRNLEEKQAEIQAITAYIRGDELQPPE